MSEEAFNVDDDDFLLAACLNAEQTTDRLQSLRNGYLWVSDLSQQMWCEQQLHLNLTSPVEVKETPQMTKGSEMHLARELETQDYVDLDVTSDEDAFGVKVLNLILAVQQLQLGGQEVRGKSREVPIFGLVKGVFFLGKIDEIQLDMKCHTLCVVEYKTRTKKCLPGQSQKDTHRIQVMLYKYLLDLIIQGKLKANEIWKAMNLDPKKQFGKSLSQHIEKTLDKITCLEDLYEQLIPIIQTLPKISKLLLDYAFQDDGESFAQESVDYDENWFHHKIETFFSYWKGQRDPIGVEIEEAWKCHYCQYAEDCSWKKKKTEEILNKSRKKIDKNTV